MRLSQGAQSPDNKVRRPLPVTFLLVAVFLAIGFACQHEPPRFVHAKHLGLKCGERGQPDCLTCVGCHSDLEAGSKNPGHASGQDCEKCHKPGDKKVMASLHPRSTSARLLATQIQFDHQKHLQNPELLGQCISCHAGVVSEKTSAPFPPMSRCFECHTHQKQWDDGVCVPCHNQSDLKNLFPRTYLRHGPGWDRGHGQAANDSVEQCKNCHSKESCDDCHDVTQGLKVEVRQAARIEKNFTHPADFITRHAMEVASEPGRCLSCHRTETCDSCHIARGVSAARIGANNPHPPGWMGPESRSENHHGRAARRDIISCASCHDQGPQTNCIDCHRVGGPGGNPHPDGWQSTRTPSDQMCNYCHSGGP